jgi:hypothetical protein
LTESLERRLSVVYAGIVVAVGTTIDVPFDTVLVPDTRSRSVSMIVDPRGASDPSRSGLPAVLETLPTRPGTGSQ